MFKKLIVFAITSGLAAQLVKSYLAKQKGKPGAPIASGDAAPRYARRSD